MANEEPVMTNTYMFTIDSLAVSPEDVVKNLRNILPSDHPVVVTSSVLEEFRTDEGYRGSSLSNQIQVLVTPE